MIHQEAELLLAAGAALDDLEPGERAAYEAHKAGCVECAVLEGELSTVLADLALVVPERMPPPDLFAGIRSAIDAEDAGRAASGPPPRLVALPVAPPSSASSTSSGTLTVAAGSTTTSGPVSLDAARRTRGIGRGALALAAVFALVAVGLGVRNLALQQELDRSTAQVAALQAEMQDQGAVLTAAMNPEHQTVALESEELAEGATAVVVFVPGTETSYIVAENLPATPAGHGYQLWYADAAGVHPLQTIGFDGQGSFVAPLDVDLAASTAVMLTLETSGGAAGEPGPQVVFGEL